MPARAARRALVGRLETGRADKVVEGGAENCCGGGGGGDAGADCGDESAEFVVWPGAAICCGSVRVPEQRLEAFFVENERKIGFLDFPVEPEKVIQFFKAGDIMFVYDFAHSLKALGKIFRARFAGKVVVRRTEFVVDGEVAMCYKV